MIQPELFRKIAYGSMILGFSLHSYGIILRMIIMSRPPISTIYETVIFVGFVIVLFSIVIEFLRKDGTWYTHRFNIGLSWRINWFQFLVN